MSFLFPLYLLGLAALSVPIFLHLRNRELKKVVRFSSLRFLQPTPIQQQQRAKIENWLLLALRCAILALLAFAFARPFLRQELMQEFEGRSEQAVILLDTSASMQRDGVWEEARGRVREIVEGLDERDEVQVMTFAGGVGILHSFDAWRESSEAERKAALLAKLEAVEPGWRATHLGQAMIGAVESFRDALEDAAGEAPAERKIYVVSDLQGGADVEALGQYAWPQEVEVVAERVGPERLEGNATVQLLPRASGLSGLREEEERFRVRNEAGSRESRFTVSWRHGDGTSASAPLSVVVAAGSTEIFAAPKTTTGMEAPLLYLEGDGVEFDNRYYRTPAVAKPLRILYQGEEDPDAPASPLYFFKRALIETPTFKPELTLKGFGETLEKVDWGLLDFLVISEPPGGYSLEAARSYLQEGGRALFLMRSVQSIPALSKLLGGVSLPAEEATVADYALLGEMDRQHPYLQSFAEARFADFTKIHFWKHRKVALEEVEDARVLARFDDGSPAWFEVPVGRGSLLVMTSGWHREDSQLALSTKFIPLLYSILTEDPSGNASKGAYFVGDTIPLEPGQEKSVTTPEGQTIQIPAEAVRFEETDMPGLYTFVEGERSTEVAVNLELEEGQLTPMESDSWDALFHRETGEGERAAEAATIAPAKLSIEEQEGRQKGWLWLLYLVLLLVIVEIFYSARCAQTRSAQESA